MDTNMNYTQEELEKLLEEAKKKAQAMLDSMTPEEQARALRNAERLAEEDRASMQKLIDEARRVAGAAQETKETPRFCQNCGAQISGGNFCEYCGSPLQ